MEKRNIWITEPVFFFSQQGGYPSSGGSSGCGQVSLLSPNYLKTRHSFLCSSTIFFIKLYNVCWLESLVFVVTWNYLAQRSKKADIVGHCNQNEVASPI